MQEGGETVESEREGRTGSAAGTQSTGEETAGRDEHLELDSGNVKIYLLLVRPHLTLVRLDESGVQRKMFYHLG